MPERKKSLIAHCLPTRWVRQDAYVAIIRTEREYDSVVYDDSNNATINSRNRLDLLFKVAGDGYWDWIIPTGHVYFSANWKKMLGYLPDEVEDTFLSWTKLIHPDDLGVFLIAWSDYMIEKEGNFSIEYRILCKNQQYHWVEAHGIKEINAFGDVERLIGFHRDISNRKINEEKIKQYQDNLEVLIKQRTAELEQANHKLAQLSKQDPLTLLDNRRSFDESIEKQLRIAKRKNYLCAYC